MLVIRRQHMGDLWPIAAVVRLRQAAVKRGLGHATARLEGVLEGTQIRAVDDAGPAPAER